jgi:hypothetical protein
VRIMAGEVGLDQMVRDHGRLTLAAARGGAHRPAQRVQPRARDGRHQAVHSRKDTALMYGPAAKDVKAGGSSRETTTWRDDLRQAALSRSGEPPPTRHAAWWNG